MITVHLQLCISLTLISVIFMRIHLQSSEIWQNQVVAIWNPKLQRSQLKTVGKERQEHTVTNSFSPFSCFNLQGRPQYTAFPMALYKGKRKSCSRYTEKNIL